MTQRQLEKRLELWQARVGLSDWTLLIRFQHIPDFQEPNRVGETSIHMESRSALIWVMYPEEYELCHFAQPQDIDHTIVHELLHIHIKSIEKEPGSVATEQVINALTAAIVRGYRCTDSPKKSKSARTSGR